MVVDFAYTLVKKILAKNIQQGYASPSDFNTFINQAQLMYLDYLLGEFEQYQYQRPIPRVQFGMNQQTRQSLTPLIGPFSPLTIDANGFSAYPDDFQQVDAMMTTDDMAIRYCQQHQKQAFLKSRIDPVATNPIYLIEGNDDTEQDGGFRFYPIELGSAKLSYIKTPPEIKWAFTTDANNRPVYDPVNSFDPVFYDLDMMEILARTLRMFGVSLQANAVSQYATEVKSVGQ